MYSVQGIFQQYFQCKKVCTILNKIWSITKKSYKNSFSRIFVNAHPAVTPMLAEHVTTTNVFLGSNPDGIRRLDLKMEIKNYIIFLPQSCRVGIVDRATADVAAEADVASCSKL